MKTKNNTNRDPRIDFFENLAEKWDNEEPSSQTMAARLKQHANLLNFSQGINMLEVGCGTGKTTLWLTQTVAPGKVRAIDFSPKMIAQAKQKNLPAEFTCLDVCCDELGENCYDVIFCFHSFPHFRDQSAALQNFSHALKPEGRLIVMHLAGSKHINDFHRNLTGAVKSDLLPQNDAWNPLLEKSNLKCSRLIDRDDLFFLEAIAAD